MEIPSSGTHNDYSFPHKCVSQKTFIMVKVNI
jgi:hypothetical protein